MTHDYYFGGRGISWYQFYLGFEIVWGFGVKRLVSIDKNNVLANQPTLHSGGDREDIKSVFLLDIV